MIKGIKKQYKKGVCVKERLRMFRHPLRGLHCKRCRNELEGRLSFLATLINELFKMVKNAHRDVKIYGSLNRD